MVAEKGLWLKVSKRIILSIFIIAMILIVLIKLILIGYGDNWTGFNGKDKSDKTLYDWLNLTGTLAIPVVVGFGAVWFTARQGRASVAENKDNQRETALQAYIDKMSELLLHENLRDSDEEAEARKIAKVRTLSILSQMDAKRKKIVMQFLFESKLIWANYSELKLKNVIPLNDANLDQADLRDIDLSGANLNFVQMKCANLSNTNFYMIHLGRANLSGSNLRNSKLKEAAFVGANMQNTDMRGADLKSADLKYADLTGAYLKDANLEGADLTDAKVTPRQLALASSLKGAIMRNGSKHE